MKAMTKYFKLLLLTIALTSLAGCSITIDSDDLYNDRLTNKMWIDEWTGGYQKIIFYSDGTGRDRFQVASSLDSYDVSFRWYWERGERNIVINYGPGDTVYFDDVQVSWDRLSGYWNDEYVEFRPF